MVLKYIYRTAQSRISRSFLNKTLKQGNWSRTAFGLVMAGGLQLALMNSSNLATVLADAEQEASIAEAISPKNCESLPTFTLDEIGKHSSMENGVWIIVGEYVYDVTEFIDMHPGGARILLAAGTNVEPFWALYPIHYDSKLVPDYLHKFRIGKVDQADLAKVKQQLEEARKNDPFGNDPTRHPILKAHQKKPFNAEPPADILAETFITPNQLWFTRNHHPVPDVDIDSYKLEIGFEYGPRRFLTFEELKAYPPIEATVTIVCAGNRRSEMNVIDKTEGLSWDCQALSTAVFKGVPLRTLMQEHGLTDENARTERDVSDVVVAGVDNPFECSIPVEKAISAWGDVMLAYEMNGEPIPRDHGYPLRFVVPGHVGARNVKWVNRVLFTDHEATSPWQSGTPYKGFAPGLKSFKDVDPSIIPSVQTLPVMSSITTPSKNELVYPSCDMVSVTDPDRPELPAKIEEKCTVEVKGWAYAGGGKGIVRVDVSGNDGKDWVTAKVEAGPTKLDIEQNKAWAWTLWSADVPVDPKFKSTTVPELKATTLAVKAVDTGYNVQPDTVAPIWNRRGILNNAWHRVPIKLTDGSEDDDDE